MAVKDQVIDVSLAGGIDQKTARKIVGPNQLRTARNVRFDELGALRKRYGYDRITLTTTKSPTEGTAGALDAHYGVYSDGAILLALAKDLTDHYERSMLRFNENEDKWHHVLRHNIGMEPNKREIGFIGEQSAKVSCVCSGQGYRYHFHTTDISGTSYVILTIIDENNDRVVKQELLVATIQVVNSLKCWFVQDNLFLMTGRTTAFDIYRVEIPIDDKDIDAITFSTVVAGQATSINNFYDACEYTDVNSNAGILYVYATAGTWRARFAYVTGSAGSYGTSLNTEYNSTINAANAIGVQGYSYDYGGGSLDYAMVAVQESADSHIYCTGLTPDASGSCAVAKPRNECIDSVAHNAQNITLSDSTYDSYVVYGAVSEEGMRVWVEYDTGSENYEHYVVTGFQPYPDASLAGYNNAMITIPGVGLAARAFTYDGVSYAPLVHDSPLQPTIFICSLGLMDNTTTSSNSFRPRYHAKILPLEAGGLTAQNSLAETIVSGSTRYFSTLRQVRLESDGQKAYSVVEASVELDKKPQLINDGQQMLFSGGFVGQYDGVNYLEIGCHHCYPESFSLSATAVAGSMSDGTYNVKLVLEWTDNQGNIHRSAPSVASSITLSGGTGAQSIRATFHNQFYYNVDMFNSISNNNGIRLFAYRTEDSGNIYYKDNASTANSVIQFFTRTFTIDLTTDDANLINNEILYTNNGEFANYAPPAANAIAVVGNRLILSQADDREKIWFSKEKEKNVGYSFAPELTKRVTDGGPITALAEMDGKVIVFKEEQIRYFHGQGVNKIGQGTSFSRDLLITNDVGCVARDSVVKYKDGIFFQSKKGVYHLGRDLVTTYIGAPIEGLLDPSHRIVNANVLPDQRQVRLLTDQSAYFAYDYLVKKWCTHSNSFFNAIDTTVWDGNDVIAENSLLHVEGTTFLDNTQFVQMYIETSWFKFAGLEGREHVWAIVILGDYKSNHQLNVQLYYDYDEITAELHQVDVTSGVYEFKIKPIKQLFKAVKLKIYDDDTSGTEESMSLNSLCFHIGVEPGISVYEDAKTF